MSRTVFYPRLKMLAFYDEDGLVYTTMYGKVALEKVKRLVRSFSFPMISLRSKIKISL